MNISYQLSNSDFLEYQLYASSKSELQKKKRFRSRIMIPIIYLLVAMYFAYKREEVGLGIAFLIFGILWFLFYPLYSKFRYKKHFQKHVEENYKNRTNKQVEINFEGNSLNIKDFTSESRINGNELRELIETKNHFFIKLTTDLSLILPKHSIENQTEFKKLVTELGAEFINELNWKWK